MHRHTGRCYDDPFLQFFLRRKGQKIRHHLLRIFRKGVPPEENTRPTGLSISDKSRNNLQLAFTMTGGNEHVHSASDGSDPANGDSHPKPPPSLPPPVNINLTPKFKSKDLRGNLMREQIDRDPLFYYEVVTVLGIGSMGSVVKVRKRDAAVGGSSRKDLQDHFRREKQMKTCFNLPLVGGFFHFCLKGMVKGPSDSEHGISQVARSTSSVLEPGAVEENYNDLHGEPAYSNKNFLAMKSIHLSRVTDQSFVEELKNEIEILRRLDHAHIVRAIETFEHRNQIFIVMVCGTSHLLGLRY
jgi:hypothetical protein